MQVISRQVEVCRISSNIQSSEDILNTIKSLTSHLAVIAAYVKPFQSSVFESSNHEEVYRASVRLSTLQKKKRGKRKQMIAIPMRLTSRRLDFAHNGLSALVGLGTMVLGCYVVFRSASGMV